MGIDRWNIYGVSYGTDLALQVLRDHPEGIRSVVIDAVLPPNINPSRPVLSTLALMGVVLGWDGLSSESLRDELGTVILTQTPKAPGLYQIVDHGQPMFVASNRSYLSATSASAFPATEVTKDSPHLHIVRPDERGKIPPVPAQQNWRCQKMTGSQRFVFSLIATISIGMGLAQTSAAQTSESPVAAASGSPGALVAPFGVPLAPPIYLINFLLLYVSNPENAAYMPAYRVALPQEVFKCLADNPDGCPYAAMAPYFAEQADGGPQNQKTLWPSSCQTSPRWGILAPRQDRQPEQINQPLGKKDADQLAKLLGIKQDMILSDQEYQCLIGAPPRDVEREVIYACTLDLTNSNGNTDIPLSSYGLYRNLKGDVRSDCAPQAPCLEFNKLFAGPLEVIAKQCGFADKLARLVSETPFLEFVREGSQCQHAWFATSCIAEAPCVGKGSPSNNECAPPIAPK